MQINLDPFSFLALYFEINLTNKRDKSISFATTFNHWLNRYCSVLNGHVKKLERKLMYLISFFFIFSKRKKYHENRS